LNSKRKVPKSINGLTSGKLVPRVPSREREREESGSVVGLSGCILIAVITVEPADKISFVYNCMQSRLRGQYNGKSPISLVCASRPLVTVITAIVWSRSLRSNSG